MDPRDQGGEAACWAHLVDGDRPDIRGRDDIQRLVVDFYRDVAMDDLLGPIFAAAHVDWSVHIPKLVDFWAWQLLGQPGYERNPLRAHEPAHSRTPFGDEHYQRWLELFDMTVDESFAGPTAEAAKQRARRMAKGLRRLLDGTSNDQDAPVEDPVGPIAGSFDRMTTAVGTTLTTVAPRVVMMSSSIATAAVARSTPLTIQALATSTARRTVTGASLPQRA